MVKKLIAVLIIVPVVALFAGFFWSSSPLKTDRSLPDRAAVHANAVTSGAPFYKEAWFDHEGRSLHYVAAGEGEVILFIHGFPSFWYSFFPQMEAFKDAYRVVAIDGLGAGRSDAPRDVDAYRLEAMAAHVNALIDHLGADKVHLVGHDWGAAFALGFAQRYPDRVMTVTGMSAPPQNVILKLLKDNAEEREIFAYVERFKRSTPLLLLASDVERRIWEGAYGPLVEEGKLSAEEGALFRHATSDPRRINAHINWYRANIPPFDEIEESDYWPSGEARIQAPALFIWGTEDAIISANSIAQIRSGADAIVLLPLEGVGHWPQIQQAGAVTEAIRSLLSEGDQD